MNDPVQRISHKPLQKSNRFLLLASALIVLFILAAVGVYTWFFVYNACEVDAVKEASTILGTQLTTYDGVFQVAVTASRTSPDHPVNTLKQIFMDTQEINVPACMGTAKNELINYMGTVISAFQAYRAGEADTKVRDLVQQSDVHYANFKAELKAVNECAPYCIP
jgi:hypothetical protein